MPLYVICIFSIDISISKSDIVIIMWDDCLLCVNLVFHVLFQALTELITKYLLYHQGEILVVFDVQIDYLSQVEQ